jgi:hypothetical protein
MSQVTFTKNVIVLALENCLICKIPELFPPEKIHLMEEAEVRELAEECEEVRRERDQCQTRLAALTKAAQDCRKFISRSHSGESQIMLRLIRVLSADCRS